MQTPSPNVPASDLTTARDTLAAHDWQPRPATLFLFAFAWLVLAIISICSGPALGDHEVIVAQIARQTLQTGDWLILHYLDTPFLVKPPLSPWLVAFFSNFFPLHAATHLPVNDVSARLPSMLATMGTIAIIFALARAMFGRRIAAVSAFVYACSFGALLYAFNATAEALLTFFCAWTFAEFWWAFTAPTRGRRRWHLARFYIALGLAMLAKGPMPLAVVCVPIAAWWWLHRAGRILAHGGPAATLRSFRRLLTDLLPRLWFALKGLGLWWGLPIFLLIFGSWMFAVGRRVPYFWELWDYEYLDRLEGQYPGSRSGNFLYYIPIAFGLMLPWSLSVPQALFTPFMKSLRKHHRPISFLWYWVVVGIGIMSLMSFKKTYYILPATPALAILLGIVLDQLFISSPINRRVARWAVRGAIAIFIIGAGACWLLGAIMYPEEWNNWVRYTSLAASLVLLAAFAWSGRLFLRNQRPASLAVVGWTALLVFTTAWHWIGPAASNIDPPLQLLRGLSDAGVPLDAEFYWAGNRPDGRVLFYGNRPVRQVVDPYRLIVEHREHISSGSELRKMVGEEICRLLDKPTPVYFVMQREDFNMLVKFLGARAEEMFSVDRGAIGRDKDDWVISANPPGIAARRKPVAL